MSSQREGGIGCGTVIAIIILIGLAGVAVISVAALIEPFSWVPPLREIFGDCTDKPETATRECALGTRYPGFWSHVIINFLYALLALGLSLALAFALPELRAARTARFDNAAALERYRHA